MLVRFLVWDDLMPACLEGSVVTRASFQTHIAKVLGDQANGKVICLSCVTIATIAQSIIYSYKKSLPYIT